MEIGAANLCWHSNVSGYVNFNTILLVRAIEHRLENTRTVGAQCEKCTFKQQWDNYLVFH